MCFSGIGKQIRTGLPHALKRGRAGARAFALAQILSKQLLPCPRFPSVAGVTARKYLFLLRDSVLQQCGMRRLATSVVFTCALIQILALDTTLGAGRKRKAPPPEQRAPVISNVTANSVTVTTQTQTRTFIVTPFTEISVNGQKGTIADLKSGMKADVTIGIDPTRAGRIVASGPQ